MSNRITIVPPGYPSAELLRQASREVHTHPTRKDLPAAKRESREKKTVREMKAVRLP
jgi:hypothetical protein